jgi:HlyD family secretion protein
LNNQKKGRLTWFSALLTVLCSATLVFGFLAMATPRWTAWKSPAERFVTTGVRRADLYPTLTASGRVESSKRTAIECELQNITVGVRGESLAAGGASVLLSVVPEGSIVKRGDVLAVLDSSDYEELLRVQRITVERAAADHVQAELNVQIAKLAVQEWIEGTVRETTQDFEGKIFLARSDLERSIDRLSWCRRMKEKGYLPAATVTSEEFRKAQLELALTQQESAYALFKKFTAPKSAMILKGAVRGAEAILEYQQLRVQRHRARLALLEKQVANCTIRAPHDGFVIYANNSDRSIFIEPGLPVRQRQTLFYLPDLNKMEVVTMLHESIVDDVRPAMRAHVQVEGLSNRPIDGHVTSIAPVSTFNWRTDVTYFEGIVKLEHVPGGLKPGMTAEVELAMPERMNVLAVPSEAIRIENGHDVCVVVHDDGLERREIKLGQVTRDLAEVTQGLAEGEQIVLNPSLDEVEHQMPPARVELSSSDSSTGTGPFPSVVAASH